MDFDSFQPFLEQSLNQYLQGKDGETPVHLAESMRYSLFAPGKRIRPQLLLACAEMLGLEPKVSFPAAAALEMIHCFTLIHDDLPCMDNDDFRRGRPSNHKKFGESTALLAGDALISLAGEVFLNSSSEAGVKSEVLMKAYRRFLWSCGPRGVIGGQAFESSLGEHATLMDLRQMHRQKTGALFTAALLIPMDLSAIQDTSAEGIAIAKFADELGLAFQVMDDLDDWGTESLEKRKHNILNYLPKETAVKETHQTLVHSQNEITLRWGEKAKSLIQISNEILIRIS